MWGKKWILWSTQIIHFISYYGIEYPSINDAKLCTCKNYANLCTCINFANLCTCINYANLCTCINYANLCTSINYANLILMYDHTCLGITNPISRIPARFFKSQSKVIKTRKIIECCSPAPPPPSKKRVN